MTSVKRLAKCARETFARAASAATVQARSGCRWIASRAGPVTGSSAPRYQPGAARLLAFEPASEGAHESPVEDAVEHGLPAGGVHPGEGVAHGVEPEHVLDLLVEDERGGQRAQQPLVPGAGGPVGPAMRTVASAACGPASIAASSIAAAGSGGRVCRGRRRGRTVRPRRSRWMPAVSSVARCRRRGRGRRSPATAVIIVSGRARRAKRSRHGGASAAWCTAAPSARMSASMSLSGSMPQR